MPLSPLGNFSYNGFSFSAYSEIVGLRARPQWDQSGRTIVYIVWTISVRDKLGAAPGQTLDATIASARNQLLAPGAALTLNSKGFGDLSANNGTGPIDVNWGPKPQDFEYKILGRDRGAEIVWTVEVALPQCPNAIFQFAIMELNYRVSYRIDFSGYSTRTVTGYLRIPQSRAGRTLGDNGDNYRAQIDPVAPDGFRRTDSTFTIDESKCRLDWSITDVEMPETAPPPGVVEVDASHSVQTQRVGPSSSLWTGTLTASYEVVKGGDKGSAFNYFVQMLTARIAANQANGTNPGSLLINYLNLAEPQIYGRKTATFVCSYRFATSLNTIVAASGLWQPVPNSNYGQWRASLATSVFDPAGRSFAGLKFNNSDEMIVDLCGGGVSTLTAGGINGQSVLTAGGQMQNAYPTPEDSFIDFQMDAQLEIEDGVAELKTLPLVAPQANANGPQLDQLDQPGPNANVDPVVAQILSTVNAIQAQYPGNTQTSQFQQRTSPSVYVILRGRAIRAGYPINPPTITQIGGVPAVSMNRKGIEYFRSGQVTNWFGVPVVAATWRLRYSLPQIPPGPIGIPPSVFN